MGTTASNAISTVRSSKSPLRRGGAPGGSQTQVNREGLPFKVFDYECPCCGSKRAVQYFYQNGVFMQQEPQVVCGNCNTSMVPEPFKTVDYKCPQCRKGRKVRVPAKPIPLEMYNSSVVSCGCGFRGQVPVGRLMAVVCSKCWNTKKELCDVWAEDGDDVKAWCEPCGGHQHGFARLVTKKGATQTEPADLEFNCGSCFRDRPVHGEELLRNQALCVCNLCGWKGYPEVRERVQPTGERGRGLSAAAASGFRRGRPPEAPEAPATADPDPDRTTAGDAGSVAPSTTQGAAASVVPTTLQSQRSSLPGVTRVGSSSVQSSNARKVTVVRPEREARAAAGKALGLGSGRPPAGREANPDTGLGLGLSRHQPAMSSVVPGGAGNLAVPEGGKTTVALRKGTRYPPPPPPKSPPPEEQASWEVQSFGEGVVPGR
mmetsp:Transcript_86034/g.230218  ORF Transcript_86034/g.230218 Transcript_86034/m.230218 type:complete len:430 (+) Transcript_86034:167-1456(+)